VHLVGFIIRTCTDTFDTPTLSKWKGAYMEAHARMCVCVCVSCHSGDCRGDGLADFLGDHICKLV